MHFVSYYHNFNIKLWLNTKHNCILHNKKSKINIISFETFIKYVRFKGKVSDFCTVVGVSGLLMMTMLILNVCYTFAGVANPEWVSLIMNKEFKKDDFAYSLIKPVHDNTLFWSPSIYFFCFEYFGKKNIFFSKL